MHGNIKNRMGQKYGRLTVLSDTGERKRNSVVWLCRCECGNLVNAVSHRLEGKGTRSCGCYLREITIERQFKHGDSGKNPHRLYRIWSGMKKRCYNPRYESYHAYGGRGIEVCGKWKNTYLAFKKWALNNGYQDNLTIDRIDVDDNYRPENCQWVTSSANSKSKRFGYFSGYLRGCIVGYAEAIKHIYAGKKK